MAFDFVTFSTDPSRPLHAYRQTSLASIRSAAGDEEAFWMYLIAFIGERISSINALFSGVVKTPRKRFKHRYSDNDRTIAILRKNAVNLDLGLLLPTFALSFC